MAKEKSPSTPPVARRAPFSGARSIMLASLAAIAAMGSSSATRASHGGGFGSGSSGFYAQTRNGRRRWKKLRQPGLVAMRRSRKARR